MPEKKIEESFGFTPEVMLSALRRIYGGELDPLRDIDPVLLGIFTECFNKAAQEGFSLATAADMDKDFVQAIRHSDEVFSAFKVHRMQKDIASFLLDADGNLKPFSEFAKDAMPVASHQCGAWLETEYDTAVLRAHQAADWMQFEREKDVLPNLKWMPSTSLHPGADHLVFWNTVRPIDDAFWNDHRPGDRWNCKCYLSSTDEPATSVPTVPDKLSKASRPQPGLDDNPAKTKAVFSQNHPYMPQSCSKCPFRSKNIIKNVFRNILKKNCYQCAAIDNCLRQAKNLGASKVRKLTFEERKSIRIDTLEWANQHLKKEMVNGREVRIARLMSKDGKEVVVIKKFFGEVFTNNLKNPKLAQIMQLSTEFEQWFPKAKLIKVEEGKHHTENFFTYHVEHRGYKIECKVRNGTVLHLYHMTII